MRAKHVLAAAVIVLLVAVQSSFAAKSSPIVGHRKAMEPRRVQDVVFGTNASADSPDPRRPIQRPISVTAVRRTVAPDVMPAHVHDVLSASLAAPVHESATRTD